MWKRFLGQTVTGTGFQSDSRGQAERARPDDSKVRLRARPEDPKVRLRARPDYPTLLLRARPNDCLLRLRRRLPS